MEHRPLRDGPTLRSSLRPMRSYIVLAFGSTRDALIAETVLVDAGLRPKVMPLPRHRGELCGVALRVLPEDEQAAKKALSNRGITIMSRDEIEDF